MHFCTRHFWKLTIEFSSFVLLEYKRFMTIMVLVDYKSCFKMLAQNCFISTYLTASFAALVHYRNNAFTFIRELYILIFRCQQRYLRLTQRLNASDTIAHNYEILMTRYLPLFSLCNKNYQQHNRTIATTAFTAVAQEVLPWMRVITESAGEHLPEITGLLLLNRTI